LAHFTEQIVYIEKTAALASDALYARIDRFCSTRVNIVTHTIDDFIELFRYPRANFSACLTSGATGIFSHGIGSRRASMDLPEA